MKALLAIFAFLLVSPAFATPENEVKATLLADVAQVQPGKPFTVGVSLEISPGWHIYWSNPGDSGLATSVRFKLPAGFKVEPNPLPVPVQFVQPGDVVGYGYHDRVLITAKVTPPADLRVGSEISAEVSASWLCCQAVCIPGRANPRLALKIAEKSGPANQALFATWAAKTPIPADKSPDVRKSSVTCDAKSHVASVDLEWKSPPKDVQLFPGASDALSIKDISDHSIDSSTRITFKLDVLQGQPLSEDKLPVLVAFTDDHGSRRGIELNVRLDSLKSPSAR